MNDFCVLLASILQISVGMLRWLFLLTVRLVHFVLCSLYGCINWMRNSADEHVLMVGCVHLFLTVPLHSSLSTSNSVQL